MSSSFATFFHLGHAYEVRSSIGIEFFDTILGIGYYSTRARDEIETELISNADSRYVSDEENEGIEELNQLQEYFSSSEIHDMIDDIPDTFTDCREFFMSGLADSKIDDWIRDNNVIEIVKETVKELSD